MRDSKVLIDCWYTCPDDDRTFFEDDIEIPIFDTPAQQQAERARPSLSACQCDFGELQAPSVTTRQLLRRLLFR